LQETYTHFQDIYADANEQALKVTSTGEGGTQRDQVPYNSTNLAHYGQDFLSRVDPFYVKDINDNL